MTVTQDESVAEAARIEVWEENWPAWEAFSRLYSQWRATALGDRLVWLGLDYAGADIVLRRRGDDDEVFWLVQEIEQGALSALNEE